MASIPIWLPRIMNIYGVGSPDEPIKEIYEVSIAAAAIRANLPGRVKQLRRLFERTIEKILKIGSAVKYWKKL